MDDAVILVTWLTCAIVRVDHPAIARAFFTCIAAWIVLMNELRKALETPHPSRNPAQICGKGHGVCLMCPGLHSNMPHTASTAPARELAERFGTVVLFDYAPHATRLDHLVDDAMGMLICCGGRDSCTIAGYSMGSTVALHLAARARRGGWTGPMHIILYAPPAHTRSGITLERKLLTGVKLFAARLDMGRACEAIGPPARLELVHAEDDEVVNVAHSEYIRSAAERSGMVVTLERRPRGGHSFLRNMK